MPQSDRAVYVLCYKDTHIQFNYKELQCVEVATLLGSCVDLEFTSDAFAAYFWSLPI